MFKTNGTRQYKMPSTGVETAMASIQGRRLMRQRKDTLIELVRKKQQLEDGRTLEKMKKAELVILLLEGPATAASSDVAGNDDAASSDVAVVAEMRKDIYWK